MGWDQRWSHSDGDDPQDHVPNNTEFPTPTDRYRWDAAPFSFSSAPISSPSHLPSLHPLPLSTYLPFSSLQLWITVTRGTSDSSPVWRCLELVTVCRRAPSVITLRCDAPLSRPALRWPRRCSSSLVVTATRTSRLSLPRTSVTRAKMIAWTIFLSGRCRIASNAETVTLFKTFLTSKALAPLFSKLSSNTDRHLRITRHAVRFIRRFWLKLAGSKQISDKKFRSERTVERCFVHYTCRPLHDAFICIATPTC